MFASVQLANNFYFQPEDEKNFISTEMEEGRNVCLVRAPWSFRLPLHLHDCGHPKFMNPQKQKKIDNLWDGEEEIKEEHLGKSWSSSACLHAGSHV